GNHSTSRHHNKRACPGCDSLQDARTHVSADRKTPPPKHVPTATQDYECSKHRYSPAPCFVETDRADFEGTPASCNDYHRQNHQTKRCRVLRKSHSDTHACFAAVLRRMAGNHPWCK